ncbi:MAG: peptidyl-prolyl cis-trans isomerase [Deltaproteobacteria bacterium]|nr:peptidyl-prolyl cis-trans isomerase [Deltaproteobacteria bacterium]
MALSWLGAFACETPPTHGDAAALVRVGNVWITEADLDRAIAREPEAARERYRQKAARKQLLEGLVKFEVMAQAAQAAGAMNDPEVLRAWKHQGIQKYIQDRIGNQTSAESIAAADVLAYYESHKEETYSQPPAVHVRQFLFDDEKTAAAFTTASKTAKKQDGTDLGYVDKNTAMPGVLKSAALALTESTPISAPVHIETGWAVLMLVDRRAPVVVPIGDVETRIRQELQRQRREQALDALIKAAQRQTKVTWAEAPGA